MRKLLWLRSPAALTRLSNPLPTARSSPLVAGSLFLRRQRQPEDGNHSLPGDIDFRFIRIRQVERLTMLAAIHFGIRPPGFFCIAACLLDHVRGVEPALQVSTTELALFVFLVAGPLSNFFDLNFVMRKLCRGLHARARHFARRQRSYPRSCGTCAAVFGPTNVIVLERLGELKAACRMLGNKERIISKPEVLWTASPIRLQEFISTTW